ncbi:MAG TPA: response regulator [Candidatus Methanoperedens sp.]|nr:response regulator [Candidatus Methanoperedens sp.]
MTDDRPGRGGAAGAGAADPGREAARILVVDDEHSIRAAAGEMLSATGFTVEAAADRDQALSVIEAFQPELILLDVDLPRVDGITFCAELQADPKTRGIPVCMITGLQDLASVQRAYDAGATDFFTKPPKWLVLVQRLRFILRANRMTRHLAAANRELTLAEAALRHEEEIKARLVSLYEGADRLGLRELQEFALDEMVQLTGSCLGCLCLYEEGQQAFTDCVWSRAMRTAPGGEALPTRIALAETGLWAHVALNRKAVIHNDAGAGDAEGCGLPGGRFAVSRHLTVPIVAEGITVGIAGVANRRDPYGHVEEIALTLLGRGLWEVIQRKRREEEVNRHQRSLQWLLRRLQVVEEDERRRLAVDLHDTIVQDLAAARLLLAETLAEEPPDGRRERLAEIDRIVRGAIGHTRALTYELSSPLLHQFGIEAAVQWLAEQTARRHGIAVRCLCPPTPLSLPADRGVLLYRIANELLRNVVKHAGAQKVTVTLAPLADGVRLEVEDDGRGFSAARPRSGATEGGGFGLFSIRERLKGIGGAVCIDTDAGRGTRVVISVPAPGDGSRADT